MERRWPAFLAMGRLLPATWNKVNQGELAVKGGVVGDDRCTSWLQKQGRGAAGSTREVEGGRRGRKE
jgi:hypothetical protein